MDCRDPAVAWSAPLEHSTTTPSITTSENAIASSPSVMNSSAVAAMGGRRLSSPNARNPAAPCSPHSIQNPIYRHIRKRFCQLPSCHEQQRRGSYGRQKDEQSAHKKLCGPSMYTVIPCHLKGPTSHSRIKLADCSRQSRLMLQSWAQSRYQSMQTISLYDSAQAVKPQTCLGMAVAKRMMLCCRPERPQRIK